MSDIATMIYNSTKAGFPTTNKENTMRLIVEKKQVYGNALVYPACNKSRLIARLAGNETLTAGTIAIAKNLGYTFETKAETI